MRPLPAKHVSEPLARVLRRIMAQQTEQPAVVLQDGTTKRGHHESKNLKGITQ